MTASTSWQQIVNGMYERGKRTLLEAASGKAAPGTLASINDQIAKEQANKWLETIKRYKPLTPQEAAAADLDIQQKIRSLNTDENLRSVRNLIPSVLQAYEGRTGTDTRAFETRTQAATNSQIELGKANADQQGALLDRNYRSYGDNILDRMAGLQKDMFDRAQNTRDSALNQIMDLSRRSTEADIDYRNQLLDFERQQNTGLRGFLGQLLPVAGTAAAIYASLR